MARNRFIEMMRFQRFDYKQTRSHRLAIDKLALISTIWNTFVENCLKHYRPGTNITVNEQLFLSKLNADLPSTCQISPTNSSSNFGWALM